MAALFGTAILYKGLGLDAVVGSITESSRQLLYSGRVAIVTYVAAAGLAVVGLFVGALSVSETALVDVGVLSVVAFVHHSVPWLAVAVLTAGVGRLLDELLVAEAVETPYLNLPFVLLSVGIVVRGFTGYLFELDVAVGPVLLSPAQRLVGYILAGVVVSLLGVRLTALLENRTVDAAAEQS